MSRLHIALWSLACLVCPGAAADGQTLETIADVESAIALVRRDIFDCTKSTKLEGDWYAGLFLDARPENGRLRDIKQRDDRQASGFFRVQSARDQLRRDIRIEFSTPEMTRFQQWTGSDVMYYADRRKLLKVQDSGNAVVIRDDRNVTSFDDGGVSVPSSAFLVNVCFDRAWPQEMAPPSEYQTRIYGSADRKTVELKSIQPNVDRTMTYVFQRRNQRWLPIQIDRYVAGQRRSKRIFDWSSVERPEQVGECFFPTGYWSETYSYDGQEADSPFYLNQMRAYRIWTPASGILQSRPDPTQMNIDISRYGPSVNRAWNAPVGAKSEFALAKLLRTPWPAVFVISVVLFLYALRVKLSSQRK